MRTGRSNDASTASLAVEALTRHAHNGDICNVIIDRVITYISATGRDGSTALSG
jgi:hypothetical protein